jgi:hypothetical protein
VPRRGSGWDSVPSGVTGETASETLRTHSGLVRVLERGSLAGKAGLARRGGDRARSSRCRPTPPAVPRRGSGWDSVPSGVTGETASETIVMGGCWKGDHSQGRRVLHGEEEIVLGQADAVTGRSGSAPAPTPNASSSRLAFSRPTPPAVPRRGSGWDSVPCLTSSRSSHRLTVCAVAAD